MGSSDAGKYLERGKEKLNRGDFKGAIEDYTEAIRLDPDDPSSYEPRGDAKRALGDIKGAIDDYTAAIRLDTEDSATAYHSRGVAKADLGDHKDAIIDYDEAIQLDPENDAAFHNRGNAKAKLGDHQGAIADYGEAIRRDPNYAGSYRERARARRAVGDESGARADEDKAREIDAANEPAPPREGPASLDIVLGAASNGNDVRFSPAINKNPHLLVVGISGMGKTTCLINLAEQFHAAGVSPFTIDFHGDLTRDLGKAFGDDLLILDPEHGIPFNPLSLTTAQLENPKGWIAHCHTLADIWCAVLSGLGEVQRDTIVLHFQQCYLESGFGTSERRKKIPSFSRFFELLEQTSQEKGGATAKKICARLRAFFDLETFSENGDEVTLDDVASRPTVLRLVGMSDMWMQTAVASFFLERLYREMFVRGQATGLRQAIIFDEAHRIAKLGLIGRLLAEARKFGTAVILSSQKILDFKDDVFEQVGSHLALRVNDADAKKMAKVLGRAEVQESLKTIAPYSGLFRSPDVQPYQHVKLRAPADD